jgi:hypothetical protein
MSLDKGVEKGGVSDLNGSNLLTESRKGGIFEHCGLDEHAFWEDYYPSIVILSSVIVWSSRESVCNFVFLAQDVLQCDIIVSKFHHISSQVSVNVLWLLKPQKGFVVGVHNNLVFSILQIVPPMSESPHYCQKFLIIDVVTPFSLVQGLEAVGNGAWFVLIIALDKGCSCGKI